MTENEAGIYVTIVSEQGERDVANARIMDDDLWLPVDALPEALGWTLKPEGLCREAVCIPLPRGHEDSYAANGFVNASAFWRLTDRCATRSAAGDIWVFGANARERAGALLSLEAPDFTLPDLSGRMHSLSDYRGRKIYLVTWASW